MWESRSPVFARIVTAFRWETSSGVSRRNIQEGRRNRAASGAALVVGSMSVATQRRDVRDEEAHAYGAHAPPWRKCDNLINAMMFFDEHAGW